MRFRKWNSEGAVSMSVLVGMVIFVVVAALLYPLVGSEVGDMTNSTHESYVGEETEAIVGMIPIFYWLAVVLTVIGVALVAIRDQL